MNPKRFSMILSNNGGSRIRVVTNLTLLKGALANRTRKFEGNSQRDNGIWCSTRSLIMEQKRMRDRTRMDRKMVGVVYLLLDVLELKG